MKKSKLKPLIWQCLVLFGALVLLLSFSEVIGMAATASLGASGFIVFVMPHKPISQQKSIIVSLKLNHSSQN
ncbi:MAG: hypothetical protein FWF76_01450 [Oscillospiraceae bacterium]|nr:hypothetical protein [Oscillospiraceae bacterium]